MTSMTHNVTGQNAMSHTAPAVVTMPRFPSGAGGESRLVNTWTCANLKVLMSWEEATLNGV
jgi:hypothetical protein